MNWLDQILAGQQGDLGEMGSVAPELSRIERQRKMMEILRQTGQNIGGPGQMVGGGGGNGKWHALPQIYVPENNVGTAIAKGAMGYAAGVGNRALDSQENAATREQHRRQMEWINKYGGSQAPAQPPVQQPAQPPINTPVPNPTIPGMEQGFLDYSMNGQQQGVSPLGKSIAALGGGSAADLPKAADDLSSVGISQVPGTTPPDARLAGPMATDTPPDVTDGASEAGAPEGMSEDDKIRWMLQGAAQDFPAAKLLLNQAGGQLMTGESKRQAASELLAQRSDAAFQLQAERLAAQTQAAIAKAETQAERDRLTAEYRQSMIDLQRFRIQSRGTGGGGGGGNASGGGDESASATAELIKDFNVLKTLTNTIKNSGGAVRTGGNVLTNAVNAALATGPGQAVGRVLGTEAQQARDEMKSLIPQMLINVKNAKNMPAAMMNSNVELALALEQFGKPGFSYEANIATLNRAIEKWEAAARSSGVPLNTLTAPNAPASGRSPVTVRNSAEWQALEPGTPYITPQGKRGVK